MSLHVQRRPDDALAELERAQRALGDSGAWWTERAEIEIRRCWIMYFFRTPDELAAAIDAARPLVESHGTALQRSALFTVLAAASIRRERYAGRGEAVGYARTALAAAAETGDPTAIAPARFELGFCLLWSDRPEEGAEEIGEALALAARIGDVTLQSRCLTHLVPARRRLGDVEGVRALLPRVIAVSGAGGMSEYLAHAEGIWRGSRGATATSRRRRASRAAPGGSGIACGRPPTSCSSGCRRGR